MNKYISENYPIAHPHFNVNQGHNLPSIEEGEGLYIIDKEGNTYLDAISGLWNVSLGYNNQTIIQSINQQLSKIAYINIGEFQNSSTVNLANLILKLLPDSFSKVIYTSSGSESIEIAIKLARQYQVLKGRKFKNELIVLDNSYHGAYYGSMSASGTYREISKMFEPTVPGFHFLSGHFKKNEQEILDETLSFIEERHNKIAGIILEPIIGSGGIISLPSQYVEIIRDKCKEYDILLIFDEVATGFGRTGKMFGMDHFSNVEPDIVCFSKGMNSGYLPLACTVFNCKIEKVFKELNVPINHLSTQNGNPVACAAGVATINEILNEDLVSEVKEKGKLLKKELTERLSKYSIVTDIRGEGLMIGIELTHRNGEIYSYQEIKSLIKTFKNRGLIVYGFYVDSFTSGISLFPSFIIKSSEIKKISVIIESVIRNS